MKFLYTFSVDRLHVDNCRSRGAHNDDDWLTMAVRVDDHAPQTVGLMAAPNVHAGDDVAGPWTVGPLLIDDAQSVQWTFSLANLSGSDADKQQAEGVRIAMGIESAMMAFVAFELSDVDQVAEDILAACSAIYSGLAELLGWLVSNPGNPNCNGEVFTNVVQFAPGDLSRLGTHAGQVSGTTSNPDTACGGAPQTTVGFSVTQVALPQQHIFYRGVDGAVDHVFFDGSTNRLWSDVWTRQGAPIASGDIATLATPGQQHAFYRGIDGAINHLFWFPGADAPLFDCWTAKAGAPAAAGDPATLATPGQQHVFYRDFDGAIDHIHWDAVQQGDPVADCWTAMATGAPLAASDPVTLGTPGQQHIFYRDAAGAINHIFWDPSFPQGVTVWDSWTARSGAPAAAGKPATMLYGAQQHVFFRGIDGSIQHIFWDGSIRPEPIWDSWSDRIGGLPPAAGDLAVMATAGQQHVFYRGVDGAINHVFWNENAPDPDHPFVVDQWTDARSRAAFAAGDPVAVAIGQQQHVFYRDLDGAISHVFWDPAAPARLFADLWTGGPEGGPAPAGNPATLL